MRQQGRGTTARERRTARLLQIGQDIPALEPQAPSHRQQPLDESPPALALMPETPLPPEHPAPQHPLRVVVRRLDPGHPGKREEALEMLQ